MKKILAITLVFIFSLVSIARAEVTQEKRTEIEKMLRVTGMEKLMTQMMDQMIAAFKKQMPGSSDDFWKKFQQKLDVHELVEKIIPVYDKYYTLDDLKAVNTFYETPAGKKILATLPQVSRECMSIGQEWGQRIGREAEAEASQESKKP